MLYTYRTRAIIIHSWLETAPEHKPYIRTEFFEKTPLKQSNGFQNGVKNIQAQTRYGCQTFNPTL